MSVLAEIAWLKRELLALKKRGTVAGGGFPVSAHASRHENGGTDEISVAGLSGVLADPQSVDVDAAGALDGDGTAGNPLAVKVDGLTIVINGDNELEVIGGGGGGGGAAWREVFSPLSNEFPASNPATPDLRNSQPVLDFDGSTDEEAVFSGVIGDDYAGGGLLVRLKVGFTSATSGTSRWQVAFERSQSGTLDIDADSFASFKSASFSAPGTSGVFDWVDVAFADGAEIDNLAAGDEYRIKVRRDADGTSGTDDITTDAELKRVIVQEDPAS